VQLTRRWRGARDRGAAAVEFVLVAPLFLLLIFGLVSFGLLLYTLVTAQQAAREGARLAAVGVDDCASWTADVRSRASGVSLADGGISMSFESFENGSPGVGDPVLVELDVDLGPIGGLYSAATTFFGDSGSIDAATVTARSRAEQIGEVTSCGA
jgi:hypothetical protein